MGILDLLFPKRCVGCGKVGNYFCARCTSSVKLIAPNESICPVCEKPAIDGKTYPKCQSKYALDGLTSFFCYDGVVRKAIKSIKYRYISDLAQEFVDLIPVSSISLTMKQCSNVIMLLPIPLHPSRYRHRGFNQAEVLGKLVAKRLHISMRTDILKRVKKTIPQVEMKDRKERLRNMENVFVVDNVSMKQCSNVLLFDDVFTTGATMRAAGKVLKQAGATFVWAITMAR